MSIEAHAERFHAEMAHQLAAELIQHGVIHPGSSLYRPDGSSANFVYFCDGPDADNSYVIKASFWGRSALRPIQATMGMDAVAAIEFTQNLEAELGNPGTVASERETRDLGLLQAVGVAVPDVAYTAANVVVTNKVAGLGLGEALVQITDNQRQRFGRDLAGLNARLAGYAAAEPVGTNQLTPVSILPTATLLGSAAHDAIQEVWADLPATWQTTLVHGDLKPNNILSTADGLTLLDPKLGITTPLQDMGKLLVRAYVSLPARVSVPFCNAYVAAMSSHVGVDPKRLEHASLLYGISEAAALTQAAQDPDLSLLGDEMPRLYAVRQTLIGMAQAMTTGEYNGPIGEHLAAHLAA